MRFIQIPKKTKGEFRKICIPNAEEKNKLRNFISALNGKAASLCGEHVQGFMVGKSPVSNAKMHIGKRFTLKFDLSDFFDTVTPEHLKGILTKEELEQLMPDGHTYQGLPTSPIVANLAALKMDDAVIKMIKKQKIDVVYSRYADDLCFSFDEYDYVKILKQFIPQIVGRCKFILNKKKTWLQDSKHGNRHITGVMVGKDDIKASRKVRRRLRAAQHQKNINEAKGLAEWCKMKMPNPDKTKISQHDINCLTTMWRLPRIHLNLLPDKGPDETYTDDDGNTVIITGDPIQVLGLSNFTSNWTSCMAHPSGAYHRHAAFWTYLKGTRIAGLLSGKTKTYGSFTRPTFRARALIHTFRDGSIFYDRIYRNSFNAGTTLSTILNAQGIKNIDERRAFCPVFKIITDELIEQNCLTGSIPENKVSNIPYFDNLNESLIRYKGQVFCCY